MRKHEELNTRDLLLRETVLRFLQKKQTGVLATLDQVNELFNIGLFTEKSALRYVVKNEYYEMMKSSDISQRSAIIDLEIRWNVSECYIKNLIYKYPHVKA